MELFASSNQHSCKGKNKFIHALRMTRCPFFFLFFFFASVFDAADADVAGAGGGGGDRQC